MAARYFGMGNEKDSQLDEFPAKRTRGTRGKSGIVTVSDNRRCLFHPRCVQYVPKRMCVCVCRDIDHVDFVCKFTHPQPHQMLCNPKREQQQNIR